MIGMTVPHAHDFHAAGLCLHLGREVGDRIELVPISRALAAEIPGGPRQLDFDARAILSAEQESAALGWICATRRALDLGAQRQRQTYRASR